MSNENYYQKDLSGMKIEKLNRQRIELLIQKTKEELKKSKHRRPLKVHFVWRTLLFLFFDENIKRELMAIQEKEFLLNQDLPKVEGNQNEPDFLIAKNKADVGRQSISVNGEIIFLPLLPLVLLWKEKRKFKRVIPPLDQVRFIRQQYAPMYLGMDRRTFAKTVKPYLKPIPIGVQGIVFDRLDLNAWADHYKACNGRPAGIPTNRSNVWDENARQDSTNVKGFGTLTNRSTVNEFEKALKLIASKKQNVI